VQQQRNTPPRAPSAAAASSAPSVSDCDMWMV
jgi:hypothetical protein